MSAALAAATETVRLQLAFSVPQTELFVFSPPAPETRCDLKSILGFQKHFPNAAADRRPVATSGGRDSDPTRGFL